MFESLGKELQSETASSNIVTQLEKKGKNSIHKALQDKQISVLIDETKINGQKFINYLFGEIAVPAVAIITECCPMQNGVNSTTVN